MLYFSDNRYFSSQIRKVSSLSSHSEREKSRRNRNGSERKKLGREKKGIEIKWEDPDQNQEKEGNLKKKRNLKRIKSELNLYIFNLIFKLISIFQDSSKKSHNLIELKTFVPIFGR